MPVAFHFLRDDWRAGSGTEPAWHVGEERTIEGVLGLCSRGYHYSPTPYDALGYAPGSVLCMVDVDTPEAPELHDGSKGVSRRRKLLAGKNVARELRLFACECAERALLRERAAGREPHEDSWAAVIVARRYAEGQATEKELMAAQVAAVTAAREMRGEEPAFETAEVAVGATQREAVTAALAVKRATARAAAWAAAWDTVKETDGAVGLPEAWGAVGAVTREAEIEWQRQQSMKILGSALVVPTEE